MKNEKKNLAIHYNFIIENGTSIFYVEKSPYPNTKVRNRHRILPNHFDVLSITSCHTAVAFIRPRANAAFSGLMDESWKCVTRDQWWKGAARHSAREGWSRCLWDFYGDEAFSACIYVRMGKRAPSRDKSDNKMSTNHLILILSFSFSLLAAS